MFARVANFLKPHHRNEQISINQISISQIVCCKRRVLLETFTPTGYHFDMTFMIGDLQLLFRILLQQSNLV